MLRRLSMNPIAVTVFLLGLLLSHAALAQEPELPEPGKNEGQSDLDQAVEIKISAESFEDLGKVIVLCESALLRGLDEENTKFARQLLASTRLERAEKICQAIFDAPRPTPQWVQLREVAVVDLRSALKHDDNMADAHYLLGRLFTLPGGDEETAMQHLSRAIELTGEDRRLRAQALAARGELGDDLDRRLEDLNTAIELIPDDPEPYRSRALVHAAQDHLDKAQEDFNKAIELEPKHAKTYEARGVFLMMQEKFEEAKASLDKAIELDPDSITAHSNRARVNSLLENHDAAIADITHAVKAAPQNLALLLLKAQLLHRADKSDEAKKDIEQILSVNPDSAEAIQLRANILAAEGKHSEALADVQRLLERDPDNVMLLIESAFIHAAAKQYDKAVEVYDKVAAIAPENWLVYRGRGDAYLSLGKQRKALADYEKALGLNPESSGVLNNLAWLLATSTDSTLRNGKRAIELATKACEVTDFKEAHILSTLAASYAETGDFKNAIKWSQKALEVSAKDTEEIGTQLKEELKSYQSKKPWREIQTPDGPKRADEEGKPVAPEIEKSTGEKSTDEKETEDETPAEKEDEDNESGDEESPESKIDENLPLPGKN